MIFRRVMRILIFRVFVVVALILVQHSCTEDGQVYELEFVSPATTQKIVENSTIHIPCQLSDMESTITSWYRNGQKIVDTSGNFVERPNNVQVERDHSLKVTQIDRSEGGEYACEVHNFILDKSWRQSHLVNVLYPQVLHPEPETIGLDVVLGQGFVLRCDAVGNPVPKITWYFQKREIQTPNDHMAKFNVSKATKEHAGEYQCVVDNNVGKPSSAKFYIRILYLPRLTAENSWVQSAIGQQTELSCYVDGNPKAKVEWFRGNELLAVGAKYLARIQGDKYTLVIKNMRYDDFANYTCQGANFLGRNSDIIFVSGLAKPALFRHSPRYRTETSYTLIWEVDSYSPVIQYNLRFRRQQRGDVDGGWIELIIPAEGRALGPIQTERFTLTGLEAATIYEASVSAKNEFGWSAQSNVFRFATVGSDVEDSSEIVMDVTSSHSPDGNTLSDANKIEENASWFTDVGCKCYVVPLLIIVSSIIVILL